jgi:hypothetical protein
VVGSPAGQHGNFGQTNYAAAKAGIAAFARTWSMELARAKVTVNAVIPTAWTAMVETIPAFAPIAEIVAAGKPLPRGVRRDHGIGMPEECAPLVVFLASDAAAEITGNIFGARGNELYLYSQPRPIRILMKEDGWTPEKMVEIALPAWRSGLTKLERTADVYNWESV